MAFDLPGLLGCQRSDQTIYIPHRKLAEKKLRPFGIGGMKTNASFLPFLPAQSWDDVKKLIHGLSVLSKAQVVLKRVPGRKSCG